VGSLLGVLPVLGKVSFEKQEMILIFSGINRYKDEG